MDDFDDLNGYEKGVVARMLLGRLIKQGCLQRSLESCDELEVVIPVRGWQLQMLAMFSEDARNHSAASKPDAVKPRANAARKHRLRTSRGEGRSGKRVADHRAADTTDRTEYL